MKKLLYALSLLVILALVTPVSAQTLLKNTTFSTAVTSTQTVIRLASVTNISVGHILVVPGIPWECMDVQSINTTLLTVTVVRGRCGLQLNYATARVVYVGPPQAFKKVPPPSAETCVRANIAYLPWVDVESGIAWTCRAGAWNGSIITALYYPSTSLPLAQLNLSEPVSTWRTLGFGW